MAVSQRMHDKINEQIQKEFFSEYFYISMEAYFASISLDGFANFFHVQAQEERDHAMKFFGYVIQTSGKVKLMHLDAPRSEFISPSEVFNLTLEHERFITKSIHSLVEAALEEKDYTTNSFLQWFINEQIEEERTMHGILDKMKLAGNEAGGLFHIDKELSALATAKIVAPLVLE